MKRIDCETIDAILCDILDYSHKLNPDPACRFQWEVIGCNVGAETVYLYYQVRRNGSLAVG